MMKIKKYIILLIPDPSQPLNVTFKESFDSITFSWHAPRFPNGIISGYSIRVYSHEAMTKDMNFNLASDEVQHQKKFTRKVVDLESETRYQIDVCTFCSDFLC